MKALVLGMLAFIAVFIAAFLAVGEFVYDYSFSVHRFPIIIGTATILLAAYAFIRLLMRPSAEGADEGADEGATPAPAWPRGTTGALVWLAAALPMVIFLGYLVGPTLYLLLYLRLHGERWLTAVAFAFGAAAIIYLGFHDLLAVRVPLYPFWWPD